MDDRRLGALKVAITVDSLSPELTGVGRYTLELCKGLQRRPDVEDLLFYRNGRWIRDPYALLSGRAPYTAASRYTPRFLHPWLNRRKIRSRLFHGTNFFLPAEAETGVITVHDLSVFRFPETHPSARIKAFERHFRSSLERVAHIITHSEAIRREVIEVLGVDQTRVTAVPLAAGPEFHPRSDQELVPVLARYGLQPGGYGLSVASIEPRKRLEETLSAWECLDESVRSRWPLAIAGGAGWENDLIRGRIERGVRAGWVRSLGYVPERDLPLLYAGARVLLYPSAYEGFGLPALEAMASGTPVLISANSCLVEVTQGAAMVVDPTDLLSFARDIERALVDQESRAQASRDGTRVAAGYSWDRFASATVAVYWKVLAGLP